MKVIFAGPSIHGLALDVADLDLRPPAEQGDIVRAIEDGATAIGLVDGVFGQRRSVWHKEILFALSQGIRVLGSSSMGALRAAECAAFGMESIGWVANAYLSGELDDDAAVAMLLGPAELGFMPLTVPLVDVLHTVKHHRMAASITADEASHLIDAAERMFFWDLTFEEIVSRSEVSPERKPALAMLLSEQAQSIKAEDARLLFQAIRQDRPRGVPVGWSMERSPYWQDFVRTSTQG